MIPTRPASVLCPDWAPLDPPVPGREKRCRSYQDGGTCWLDDRFVCSEWERAVGAGKTPTGPRRPLPVVPGGTEQVGRLSPRGGQPASSSVPPHTCHAHACAVAVLPEKLFCGRHWAMTPKVLQEAVYAADSGQCDDKDPSPAWHEAADLAIAEVAAKEGHAEVAMRARASASRWGAVRMAGPLAGLPPGTVDALRPPQRPVAPALTLDPPPPVRSAPLATTAPVDAPGSPDAGFALAPPAPKAPKPPSAAERARAAYEAKLPGGRRVTVADPPPFEAAKEIAPESIAALAAIADRIELDAGPLGRVVLVAKRGPEDEVPGAPIALTFDEAATLRLLVDSLPGARVVAIRKTHQGDDSDPLS